MSRRRRALTSYLNCCIMVRRSRWLPLQSPPRLERYPRAVALAVAAVFPAAVASCVLWLPAAVFPATSSGFQLRSPAAVSMDVTLDVTMDVTMDTMDVTIDVTMVTMDVTMDVTEGQCPGGIPGCDHGCSRGYPWVPLTRVGGYPPVGAVRSA